MIVSSFTIRLFKARAFKGAYRTAQRMIAQVKTSVRPLWTAWNCRNVNCVATMARNTTTAAPWESFESWEHLVLNRVFSLAA